MFPRKHFLVAPALAAFLLLLLLTPLSANAAQGGGGSGGVATTGQQLSISVPSPASGTVTITAAVNKASGSTEITISIDSSKVASCAKSPCSYQWNTRTTSNGSHTVSAQAVQKTQGGKTTLSASVTVTVINDWTAPTVSVTAPATATGLVTISAAATDASGISALSVYLDGSLRGTYATANVSLQWDSTKVADGSHIFQATASDPFGNVGTSAPVTVLVSNPTRATVLLDNFEETSLFVVQPTQTDPSYRYLWNQYPNDFYAGPDPGLATLTAGTAHDGTQSLQGVVTAGNVYLQFYPNDGVTWHFMHEYVQPPTAWTTNTYTRMRFWIKVPPTIVPFTGGTANVQLGTYVRAPNGDPYAAGTHYYHFYNLKYTGEWEQVIFDTHPTYLIGAGGGTELGNVQYPFPTTWPTWNYFDALTRFYWDGQGALSAYPATFYFDGFELFQGRPTENIDQIYSLHGVYVPSTNEVSVGWSHPKNDGTTIHEVRYAFQDIFQLGWANAAPAPNGLVAPTSDVYNIMAYSTTQINVTGQSVVYIGIKPQNSDRFRQIALPTGRGIPAPLP